MATTLPLMPAMGTSSGKVDKCPLISERTGHVSA
jgi:hypothetical protein